MNNWVKGRSGEYWKLKLLESKRFHWDVYLLYVPQDTYITPHRDPCPREYTHERLNIRIYGHSIHIQGRIDPILYRGIWSRFRASSTHSFHAKTGCLLLSIGWLRKRVK